MIKSKKPRGRSVCCSCLDCKPHEVFESDVGGDEGGSEYEKYQDRGVFSSGNHPSCHVHAVFGNEWIKPRVKQMLEVMN